MPKRKKGRGRMRAVGKLIRECKAPTGTTLSFMSINPGLERRWAHTSQNRPERPRSALSAMAARTVLLAPEAWAAIISERNTKMPTITRLMSAAATR